MNKLSGIKDVDREILKHLDDESLLKACSVNRRMWNDVCDDAFLRRRLVGRYPGIEKYKLENETWKRFFLRYVYYTSKMREQYEFEYSGGNFKQQYELLKSYGGGHDYLLLSAAIIGDLSLVKYAIEKGVKPYYAALETAATHGHLEVVKYLVEKGADIHESDEEVLAMASFKGELNVVKYLVEQGADIHADIDKAFRYAAEAGHLPVVKYLVEQGADIHAANDEAFQTKHQSVLEYLRKFV